MTDRRTTQQIADDREAAGVHCLDCGHRVKWHHDTEGCDFHGRGPHRCPCRLSSDTVARQRPSTPTAALADTDTLTWCPTHNAYALPGCDDPGLSHGHYDVQVDDAGTVLTSTAVQYERQRTASYFVAPDPDDTVTLWRGQPGDTRPLPVLTQLALAGHPVLWDHLTAGLQVQDS